MSVSRDPRFMSVPRCGGVLFLRISLRGSSQNRKLQSVTTFSYTTEIGLYARLIHDRSSVGNNTICPISSMKFVRYLIFCLYVIIDITVSQSHLWNQSDLLFPTRSGCLVRRFVGIFYRLALLFHRLTLLFLRLTLLFVPVSSVSQTPAIRDDPTEETGRAKRVAQASHHRRKRRRRNSRD